MSTETTKSGPLSTREVYFKRENVGGHDQIPYLVASIGIWSIRVCSTEQNQVKCGESVGATLFTAISTVHN